MPGEIKKRIKEQKITLESLAPGLHEIKSINSLAAQQILILVTEQLILRKVDLKTDLKIEIIWNKLPKSRNLDWKTEARIKAEIIENCPVPYFHETEYFDDMKPTIISFGRAPGNFSGTDIDPDEGLGTPTES